MCPCHKPPGFGNRRSLPLFVQKCQVSENFTKGRFFSAKIYGFHRRHPERKGRLAVFVGDGKIPLSYYIHADEHIGIAYHVACGHPDVRKSPPAGKADIDKKDLPVGDAARMMHLRHADRLKLAGANDLFCDHGICRTGIPNGNELFGQGKLLGRPGIKSDGDGDCGC